MVYRVYVEKKKGLENEANALYSEIKTFLGIKNIDKVRIMNRYDVENITKELFDYSVKTVFSEPQLDNVYFTLENDGAVVFATEYLPGQFDQRADSAAQCIQLISKGDKPSVQSARVYMLYGTLSDSEIKAIKKHVINPVEAREASLEEKDTIKAEYDIPEDVKIIDGFIDLDKDGLAAFVKSYALAMDNDDIKFCQDYFKSEGRNPTVTEIRMIDTYWSDHCRHTTFLTTIDNVKFEDKILQETYDDYINTRKLLNRTKPVNLMDIATLAVKYLKKEGKLDKLDESEEINACTVKITVEIDGKAEPWLLLFKNETHNHPTEIEPFGGAATCIGGAIRDPLSGRSYVYGAMRLTGAADPLRSLDETIEGKLPQRKIVTTAAAGYSSYGNQIGLATGIVDEIYHDGYAAKHMEVGAVIAAAPERNVRRERPEDGDVVVLLGGRTGRDGCGGATGSSKSHTVDSLEQCGAEVQKGNAPEERKLQRLFRNYDACRMIKRCNDFGAGGVSVAIGELADGLEINLNAVPKKYDGLDGTELAISESQERMAVVIEKENVQKFLALAHSENLEATVVATVKAEPRLRMLHNGKAIVDISREFLNSNGAEKHIDIAPTKLEDYNKEIPADFESGIKDICDNINTCSKRGLSERFDSTIGAGTVLMPFGGKYQRTPIQSMVHLISSEKGHTNDCSYMSWGYNPFISEKSPFHGAYLAVVESVSKLIATGAEFKDVYLTFQEYFEKPLKDPKRWGKPLSALLGAFKAQKDFGIGAIGGKDSMSGSFEKLDVPPTLISFAVTNGKTNEVISPEFKKSGSKVVILKPEYDENMLPNIDSILALYDKVTELMRGGKVLSAYTPTIGGVAEAVYKMAIGNGFGFEFDNGLSLKDIFGYCYGAFILELSEDIEIGTVLGRVADNGTISYNGKKVCMCALTELYENKLEGVYPCNIKSSEEKPETVSYETEKILASSIKVTKPKVLIPVFPGTNCEYDSAKAVEDAGAQAEIFVINNLSADDIKRSSESFVKLLKESQMIFVPGGFSGGDEPDGSGKFITAFFRGADVKEAVTELLDKRDGLMCGICNGFQALVKLGLVPYGKIIDTDENCPTLTFNNIARHQSKIVRTRVASNKSPWLSECNVGDIYNVAISHGEGKFLANDATIAELIKNGQIATQYVDLNGEATYDIDYNPNGSSLAIEGILSPDGRVIGKMGHSERIANGLYKNVYGDYDIKMFKSAVKYFK
ncbi:MAG: phosphoribosylformylglycinamidine synthase [Clostridia bacterium]|nr:phosphoribosylformylglycinamidine synthase [Clostridia bacterium]MBQ8393058.1 phosphoribosylformylglycinamidine synthase [Clostridia bacterium]